MKHSIWIWIGSLLCIALFAAACSHTKSPQPTALRETTTVASTAETTIAISTLTPSVEAPGATSTPRVVAALPTQVLPTTTLIPTLPPLPQVAGSSTCPGTRVSVLMPGRRGQVKNTSAAANPVRSEASTQGMAVGEIPPGGAFDILAGPKCADGMAWFEVRSEQSVQGWMAEGNAEEYWVMPIVTDAQNVASLESALPGFTLDLPAEVRSKIQITSLPFDPETRTPPVTIARLKDYPWGKCTSTIYVYPVEDYLYYRPEGRAALEQVRSAINTLLVTPDASVTLMNVAPSLTLSDTYLAQAGVINGGIGVHTIAFFAPADGSQISRPKYAFWGFSADMKYLIFTAFDSLLKVNQPPQVTKNDFQLRIALLDQVFGFTPIAAAPAATNGAEIKACPGAPEIRLALNDWARVSVDLSHTNRLVSSPGDSGEVIGEIQPGENVLILDGPQCVNGYAWWRVRNLDGLEGWTPEGDSTAYWLVEPISVWYQLPAPIQPGSTKTYDLREMRISPETGLVSGIEGTYYPLATPMPTPATTETPWPDDPRAGIFGGVTYTAHSAYTLSGAVDSFMWVFDIQDPVSRNYLSLPGGEDCIQEVRKYLENNTLGESDLYPFCGLNDKVPLHFMVDVKTIQFSGGKGIRFLISSSNYQTVNKLDYIFQGLSDDGRYFISVLFEGVYHPYVVGNELFEMNFGPLIAWRAGQYDQAIQSYKVFNNRMKQLLEAGVVPLYPSLDILDAMMGSIEIK